MNLFPVILFVVVDPVMLSLAVGCICGYEIINIAIRV